MSGSAKSGNSKRKQSPQVFYGVIAFALAAGAALLLYIWLGWDIYWLWLLVVNVIAFFFYRYDKRQAEHNAWRVPENVLLLLTLTGGFVGAGLGMYMRPRHKVHKPKFVLSLFAGAAIQAVLIYFLYLR